MNNALCHILDNKIWLLPSTYLELSPLLAPVCRFLDCSTVSVTVFGLLALLSLSAQNNWEFFRPLRFLYPLCLWRSERRRSPSLPSQNILWVPPSTAFVTLWVPSSVLSFFLKILSPFSESALSFCVCCSTRKNGLWFYLWRCCDSSCPPCRKFKQELAKQNGFKFLRLYQPDVRLERHHLKKYLTFPNILTNETNDQSHSHLSHPTFSFPSFQRDSNLRSVSFQTDSF